MIGLFKEKEEDDYDPHLHRENEHPTTNFETLAHLIKCLIGTGILAMPEAFKNSGIILGPIVMVLVGVLVTFGVVIVIKCQYILCKKKKVPIMSIAEACKYGIQEGPPKYKFFEKIIPGLVDFLIIAYQLGICCVYILFVAETTKQMADHYFGWNLNKHVIMVVVSALQLLMVMIRNLKLLAPFSMGANIIIILGLGFVVYFIFKDFPKHIDVDMFGPPVEYAQFYGTVLFALEAIAVVIALENNMATPKSFMGWFGILNQGMAIVTFLYCFIGVAGYLAYGKDIESSITLNLPTDHWLGQAVKIAFGIAIFFSYAIQFYVPIEILWERLVKARVKENRYALYNRVLRAAGVLVTLVASLIIPYLGLFISFIGAVTLPLLGFAIPGFLEYVTRWGNRETEKNWKLTVAIDLFLIVGGIISTILASVLNIMAIVKQIMDDLK